MDDAGLTPTQFRVYLHICRRGACWASVATIEHTPQVTALDLAKVAARLEPKMESGSLERATQLLEEADKWLAADRDGSRSQQHDAFLKSFGYKLYRFDELLEEVAGATPGRKKAVTKVGNITTEAELKKAIQTHCHDAESIIQRRWMTQNEVDDLNARLRDASHKRTAAATSARNEYRCKSKQPR